MVDGQCRVRKPLPGVSGLRTSPCHQTASFNFIRQMGTPLSESPAPAFTAGGRWGCPGQCEGLTLWWRCSSVLGLIAVAVAISAIRPVTQDVQTAPAWVV